MGGETLKTAILQDLMQAIGRKATMGLIRDFIEDDLGRHKKIAKAFAEKDFKTLENLAHTMGSNAAMYGGMKLHDLCRAIEGACEQGQHELAGALMDQYDAVSWENYTALRTYLDSLGRANTP